MTTSNSFHQSNFGTFGQSLPCDQNGYVHLTADAWMSAPMDWGFPKPDGDDLRAAAEELAQQSRAATAEAESALADWRGDDDTHEDTTIAGCQIQYDASGQGHAWKNIDRDDIPANIVEEIECEIIDGGNDECDEFVASNGLYYRWTSK